MAEGGNLPIILIEVVLVFGGVLAFGWWQLRSVKRDRERSKARQAEAVRPADAPTLPPSSPPSSPPPPPPPAR